MRFVFSFCLIVMLGLMPGCATAPALRLGDAIVVNVAADGAISYYVKTRDVEGGVRGRGMKLSELPEYRIVYEKKNIAMSALADELKSMKATGNTMITIKGHSDVSAQTLFSIRNGLVRKGLAKVVIARQQEPKAFTKSRKR